MARGLSDASNTTSISQFYIKKEPSLSTRTACTARVNQLITVDKYIHQTSHYKQTKLCSLRIRVEVKSLITLLLWQLLIVVMVTNDKSDLERG